MKGRQRIVPGANTVAMSARDLPHASCGRALVGRLAGVVFCAAITLLLFLGASSVRGDDLIRAVRVDADSPTLRSAEGCVALVEHLRSIHATDLFVEVYTRGEGLYRSDLAPMPRDLEAVGHNPLGSILTEAHRVPDRLIRVHAVVDLFLVSEGDSVVLQSDRSPMQRHPEWLTRNHMGTTRDDDRNAYLDLGVPEVRAHAESLIRDLAFRYPVDGLCLSGFRYPGVDRTWGYAPGALEAFWHDTGSMGHTPEPEKADWLAWRRERLTTLLTDLTAAVRETRPGTVMSVVGLATGRPPGDEEAEPDFERALQDWPEWTRENRIDWLVLDNQQDQQREPALFPAWLEFAQEQQADAKLVLAIAGWLNFDSDTVMQMRMALAREADGILLDSYDRPALDVVSPRGLLDYLGNTVFSPGYVVPEFAFDAPPASASAQPELFADSTLLPSLPPPIPLSESFASAEPEVEPSREPPPSYSQADATRALLGLDNESTRPTGAPPKTAEPGKRKDPLGRNSATEQATSRPASYALDISRLVQLTLSSGKTIEGELLRHDDHAVVVRPMNASGGVEITFRRADVLKIQDIRPR